MNSTTKKRLESLSHRVDVERWELDSLASQYFYPPAPPLSPPEFSPIYGVNIAIDDRLADNEFAFVNHEQANAVLPFETGE
jgi:hypothetical protein